MLRSFGLRENCLRRNLTCTGEAVEPIVIPQESLWVDMYDPTPQEREAIEREWDARGEFPVYPVTPLRPRPAGGAA